LLRYKEEGKMLLLLHTATKSSSRMQLQLQQHFPFFFSLGNPKRAFKKLGWTEIFEVWMLRNRTHLCGLFFVIIAFGVFTVF
jgi:hypothetical protein